MALKDDTLSHNIAYFPSGKAATIYFKSNYTLNTVRLFTQRLLKSALDDTIKFHYKH